MKRINNYKTTDAMALDALAKGMEGKVYNLSAGDPNIDVCDAICQAFHETDLQATHNYGPAQGSVKLRKRLWARPEEVIIANGAKQLIYESLQVVTKPGDKVLVIGPAYTSYLRICEILGLEYVLLVGEEKDNYIPGIEKIREELTPDFSAVLINNPNNPTGAVYDEDYIEALYDLVIENDCWLIADEIYMFIVEEDTTVMTLRGMDNVIVVDGFSKSLNLTGWRMGYAIGCKEVIASIAALQSQLSGAPSTLTQDIIYRAWPAMELTDYSAYRERIDILCQIEKFAAHKPKGGFYFLVPIDDRWGSSMELCEYMLKEHRIAITPGDGYGVPGTVRISVAYTTVEELKNIVDKLREI